MKTLKVTVVGAGVIGLSTAICLAEEGCEVRILAAELPLQTTSAVASAMCGPVVDRGADPAVGWEQATIAAMIELAEREPGSGVHLETGLLAARGPGSGPPVAPTDLPSMRPATPDELPEGYQSGVWATLPLVDMQRYLGYLQTRLAAAGGVIEQRRVSSLSELVTSAGQVVNCSGVFARYLVPDEGVRAWWGQHLVVDNPGISGFFMEAPGSPIWAAYWVHGDRVVLGGIAKQDEWNREPSAEVAAAIRERCEAIEPVLANASVIEHQAGLRPGRARVRLEAEDLAGGRLVHNYGHGGSGVSLSWGCAQEAARAIFTGPD